jgi:hypothetical protein
VSVAVSEAQGTQGDLRLWLCLQGALAGPKDRNPPKKVTALQRGHSSGEKSSGTFTIPVQGCWGCDSSVSSHTVVPSPTGPALYWDHPSRKGHVMVSLFWGSVSGRFSPSFLLPLQSPELWPRVQVGWTGGIRSSLMIYCGTQRNIRPALWLK